PAAAAARRPGRACVPRSWPRAAARRPSWLGLGSSREQRAQHVGQDAAVAEVLGLARRVDAYASVKALLGAAWRLRPHGDLARRRSALVHGLRQAVDREDLLAAQPQRA